MDTRGRFIVFEGIDGSGKSTQIRLLSDYLRKSHNKVYETREPTDSPIGSLIHQMMTRRIVSNDKTIAALFVADRIDHLLNDVNGVLAKVNDGTIVISDRYYFSSYAYHGIHIPLDWVINANRLSAEILRPDLNIFIDVSPENCVERIKKERWHLELYENLDNLRRVRDKYFEAFERLKGDEKVVIVDGNGSAKEVFGRVMQSVDSIITGGQTLGKS